MTHPAVATYLRWAARLPDLSGLNEDDAHSEFLYAHDRRCGLCREPFDDRGNRVLDHDHRTGLVRGYLCHGCNVAMPSHVLTGRLAAADRPAITLYTQYPPAAAANYRAIYWSTWGKDPAPDLRRHRWHAGPEGLWRKGDHDVRKRWSGRWAPS